MSKLAKNQEIVASKVKAGKSRSLDEASKLLKETIFTRFDASVNMNTHLGVDPRKANQMVHDTISLPHGIGKEVRVLALCTPGKEAKAQETGADYVGLDEYINKIKSGWTDIDVIITMPSVMGRIGALDRVLGSRGLVPNPKSGTATSDLGIAIREVKAGRVSFKVDKTGIIHTSVGKISFDPKQIRKDTKEFISTVLRLEPSSAKGTYIKSIYLSTTISAGIRIDSKSVVSAAE